MQLLSGERFGAVTNSSINIGHHTVYDIHNCTHGMMVFCVPSATNKLDCTRLQGTHKHRQLFLPTGGAKRGNCINTQPFSKHNSLFINYHTLGLGQRGMTDTKNRP